MTVFEEQFDIAKYIYFNKKDFTDYEEKLIERRMQIEFPKWDNIEEFLNFITETHLNITSFESAKEAYRFFVWECLDRCVTIEKLLDGTEVY